MKRKLGGFVCSFIGHRVVRHEALRAWACRRCGELMFTDCEIAGGCNVCSRSEG